MSIEPHEQIRKKAQRSKYRNLYYHLHDLQVAEWRASFKEIETILGFKLPPSARLHRPWWANQKNPGTHTHSQSWAAAGWITADVDLRAEALTFRRKSSRRRNITLDDVWPAHKAGGWPTGFTASREQIYEERI